MFRLFVYTMKQKGHALFIRNLQLLITQVAAENDDHNNRGGSIKTQQQVVTLLQLQTWWMF